MQKSKKQGGTRNEKGYIDIGVCRFNPAFDLLSGRRNQAEVCELFSAHTQKFDHYGKILQGAE
jgi:hypothetical protein